MADLTGFSETEIFQELQRRYSSGVIAGMDSGKDENFYFWWGDRLVNLGFCGRLSYGVNEEMSHSETEEEEVASENANLGNYL